MPFDPNVISQGMQAGAAIPNKNTGLSEMIRTITNDLKQAKLQNIDSQKENVKINTEIFKSFLAGNYRPPQGWGYQDLMSGNFSGFQRGGMFGQPGADNMLTQDGGMTGYLPPEYTIDEMGNTKMIIKPNIIDQTMLNAAEKAVPFWQKITPTTWFQPEQVRYGQLNKAYLQQRGIVPSNQINQNRSSGGLIINSITQK